MNQQKEKSNKTENLSDVYGISLRLSAQAPTTRQPSQPPFHDHPFLVLGLVSLRCLAWTRLVTLHRTWLYMSPVRRWLRFFLVLRGRTLVLGLVSLRLLVWPRFMTLVMISVFMSPFRRWLGIFSVRRWLRFVLVLRGRTLVLGLVSLRRLAWTRLVILHRSWPYISPVRSWLGLSSVQRWLGFFPVRRWPRFVLVLRGRTLVLGLVSLRRLAWTRLVTLHRIWVYVSPVRRWQRLSPIRRWLGLRFVLVLRGRTLHIGDITSRLCDHDAISVTLSRDE